MLFLLSRTIIHAVNGFFKPDPDSDRALYTGRIVLLVLIAMPVVFPSTLNPLA
jgi:hypothetical protein